MRFLRLDLQAYGPFTQRKLEFADGGPNLHLIYGPNEAGKSTTLRAISSLLFGIDKKTQDAHRHELSDLRIGACLQHSSGEEREFVRRKGSAGSLLDPSGATLEEALLQSWMSVSDRRQFELMFGLSHEQLRIAGEELTNAESDAGEMLFGAALDGTVLHQALSRLRDDSNKLLTAGGGGGTLHKALQAHRHLMSQVKDQALPSRKWDQLQVELEAAEEARAKLSQEIVTRTAERTRLERLRKALPWLDRRETARRQLVELGSVRRLAPGTGDLRRSRSQAQDSTGLTLAEVEAKLARTEQERSELVVPELLLNSAERIKKLTEDLGEYKGWVQDKPGVALRAITLGNQEREILKALGLPELTQKDVEQVRVEEATEKRVRALDKAGLGVQERLALQRSLLARERVSLLNLEKELAAAPPDADLQVLRSTWARVQPLRQGDHELHEAEAQASRAEQKVRDAVGMLRPWAGEPESATSMPVPTPETIEGFDDEFSDLARDRKQLVKQLEAVEERIPEHERAKEKSNAAGELPTETQLRAARSHRNEGWRHVLGAWEAGELPAVSLPEYADGAPLTKAYANAVDAADTLSDRLRAESNRVAKYEGVLEALREARAERKEIGAKLGTLAEQQERRTADWKQLWKSCSLEPQMPREMRVWRTRYETLLAAVHLQREAQTHRGRLLRQLDGARRELEAALTEGGRAEPSSESWATLCSRAEEILGRADQQASHVRQLRKEVTQVQASLVTVEAGLQAAEQAQAEWRSEWAEAMAKLRLSPRATGDEANSVLDNLGRLFKAESERQGFEKRLASLNERIAAFDLYVVGLAGSLAPELKGSAVELADGLIRCHAEATQAAGRRRLLDEQVTVLREEESKARLHRDLARKQIEDLLQETNCATLQDLESEEARSAQVVALEAEIAKAEEHLLEVADGWTMGSLQQAAVGAQADQLERANLEAGERLKTLEVEQQEKMRQAAMLAAQQAQFSGVDSAAQLANEAQEQLAAARSGAERFARLKLAAAVLQRAVEAYRQKNEGPIIKRAGDLFQRLTRGRYQNLKIEYVEGKALLRCVRQGEPVDVAEALSDGTRDQLFLSLRLASLEHHLSAQEPMPLVLDDIFVHFDEERTKVGLQILAEVAQKTQVILLTHHAKNLELAAGVLAQDQWKEHRLPPAAVGPPAEATETERRA